MTPNSITVFLHIVAMLGVFYAFGAEWLILSNVLRAAEARAWIRASAIWPAVARTSLALILVTGIYLTSRANGWKMAWIPVSLGAVILIGFLSGIVARHIRSMLQTAADETPVCLDDYRRLAADPGHRILLRVRILTALAIVLLMTTRAGITGSLMVMSAAVAAALLWSVSTGQRVQRAASSRGA